MARPLFPVAQLFVVFLVVFLGLVEPGGGKDLGGDGPVVLARGIELSDSLQRRFFLGFVLIEHSRSVLCPAIRSLPVDLGRVMEPEESVQELRIAHDARAEDDLAGFGVTGGVRADPLVGGVLGVSARIADPGGKDTLDPPKLVLHSPEAAGGKDSRLRPGLTQYPVLLWGQNVFPLFIGPRGLLNHLRLLMKQGVLFAGLFRGSSRRILSSRDSRH